MSLGTCSCGAAAICVVNTTPACLEHLDDAMRPIGEAVTAIRELVAAGLVDGDGRIRRTAEVRLRLVVDEPV